MLESEKKFDSRLQTAVNLVSTMVVEGGKDTLNVFFLYLSGH